MHALMPFLVGGGSAAALMLYHLVLSRGFRISLRGSIWWLLILLVEGIQGVLAVLFVTLGAERFHSIEGWPAWVLAGVVAPRVVRKLQYGSPGHGFALDLQDAFDRIRIPLESRIDSASAEAQSAVDGKLVTKLMSRGVTAQRLADELLLVIRTRKALETKSNDARYIRRTAINADESEEAKLRLMVEAARRLGILATPRRLARRTRPAAALMPAAILSADAGPED